MQTLIAHETISIYVHGCGTRYIRFEQVHQISDKVPLHVGMSIRDKTAWLDIQNLAWDEQQQRYETHLPVRKMEIGTVLKDYVKQLQRAGWTLVSQDQDIEL